MGALMNSRILPKRKLAQPGVAQPSQTGAVAGGNMGTAPEPQAPPRSPALSMRPAQPPAAAPAPLPIRPIQQIKLTQNAKAPGAWNLPKNAGELPPHVMTATAGALPGNANAAKNGKGGKKGKGGVSGAANQNGPIAPMDPNAKLPGAGNGGGASGGASSQGGGVSGGASGQTPPAAPAVDLNGQRVDLMSQILSNPESMTPEVINSMVAQMRDSRDLRAQDMQRRLKEEYAGRGMGESGVLDRLLFDESLAANADIVNAERGIRTDAARTNFNDRINSVNTALQQALGMGGLALQFQNMTNQQFNQDRNFQLQLADAMTQTGLIGQQQQSSLLAQMNALISGGMSWQEALKQSIQQAAYMRYADPNVGAVAQVGEASNPYLQYMASQQTGGGGSSDTDWFNAALQGGASIAGLFV